jgi:hypothetical protein
MGRKDAADGGVQELLQANPLVDWAVSICVSNNPNVLARSRCVLDIYPIRDTSLVPTLTYLGGIAGKISRCHCYARIFLRFCICNSVS